MIKPRTLFEAATKRGRVQRQGEIVCITMDGAGSMVVPAQEFVGAQKWSSSKPFSGNLLTDRARFLDQFSALISRPNSMQPTRGNERQVDRLARAMKNAGYDLNEWQVPPEMKDPKYWMQKVDEPDKDKTPGEETPAQDGD